LGTAPLARDPEPNESGIYNAALHSFTRADTPYMHGGFSPHRWGERSEPQQNSGDTPSCQTGMNTGRLGVDERDGGSRGKVMMLGFASLTPGYALVFIARQGIHINRKHSYQ
jgi:hypothetical protein